MTNPFIINQQQEEDNNPFVVRRGGFSSNSSPDFLGGMLNRMGQVARVFYYTNPYTTIGDPRRTDLLQKIAGNLDTIKPAAQEAVQKMQDNVASLFDRDNYKRLAEKVKGFGSDLVNDPVGTVAKSGSAIAQTIMSLPVNTVASFTVDPFEAVTGVDTSSPELKALSVDARADRMKSTAANAVSLAVGIGTSKAMNAAFGFRQQMLLGGPATKETLEKASIGQLLGASKYGDRIGVIGQTIIDDVVGSVVGGGTQGVLAAQDPNDAITGLATGVLFAPIGVATGYIRGRNAITSGAVTHVQQVANDAHDVAMLRQLRYAESKSIDELKNNAKALISSDNVAQAVVTGKVKTKPNAIGVINNVSDPNAITPADQIVRTYKYRNSEGKYDVLFTGPERRLANHETSYFENYGRLPSTAKFIQEVDNQGQTYHVVGRNGENVTLKHSITGDEITARQDQVSIKDVELKPFTEEHFVNKLWSDFEKFLKPGENFTTQLINFSSLKGLGNDITPLANAFMQKLHKVGVDNLSPSEYNTYQMHKTGVQLAMDAQRKANAAANQAGKEASAHSLVTEAEMHGYYIEDDGGLLAVRSIEGNDTMGRFGSTEDALKFVRGSGSAIEAPSLDVDAHVPSAVSGLSVPVTPAKSNLSTPWQPMAQGRVERAINRFDSAHPQVATAEQFFVGTDGTQGTSTKLAFIDTQDAGRRTNAAIEESRKHPKMQQLKSTLNRLTPTQREQVALLRETSSIEELEAPGGIARNYQIKPQSIETAKWFQAKAQDFNKALRWLREKSSLEMRYKMQYQARINTANMLDPTLTPEQLVAARDAEVTKATQWKLDPEYQLELQQLQKRFGVDPAFEEGAKKIDALFQSPTGSMDVYAASRYHRALVEPELSGLSKKDFIDRHKLNTHQVMAEKLLGDLYDEFGRKFGIDDSRFITNYLNHYRIFGDPMDLTGLDYYTRGIQDGNKRRFVSDMVRTGEILNYERDPMRAIDNYVRAGHKADLLYPVLDQADERIRGELKKIAAQDTRESVAKRWVEYTSALSGAQTLDQRAANAVMMQHLKNLGLDDAQVVAKMNESPVLNTVLNVVNSSVMGGRLMMAMRDMNDAITKYFTLHGAERTKNFLKKGFTAEQLDRLKEQGIVKSTTFEEMYDPGSLQPSIQNRAGSISHKAAEIGFKLSGQGVVYERVQAAAYLENREYIGKELLKLSRNEITKEQAYENIFINKHDNVVAKKFDDLVSNGKWEQATHFLAQEETHIVSGLFGLGNQPAGARSTFGRLFGQLGSYSIANRSFYWKIGSKGTTKEIARTLTRYSMSQSALFLAGAATGLNISRWMVTPLSFVFTGGPLIDAIKTGTSAVTATTGGSDSQREYAYRQAERQGWLAVPFGYAIRDLYKAWDLLDTQPNANPFHVGAQALGVPPLNR